MVRVGTNAVRAAPIAGGQTDPFVGNRPFTADARTRYSTGAPHSEGNSAGDYFPARTRMRPGITTITVEAPQPTAGEPPRELWSPAALREIERLHARLLREIFLGPPIRDTEPTTPR